MKDGSAFPGKQRDLLPDIFRPTHPTFASWPLRTPPTVVVSARNDRLHMRPLTAVEALLRLTVSAPGSHRFQAQFCLKRQSATCTRGERQRRPSCRPRPVAARLLQSSPTSTAMLLSAARTQVATGPLPSKRTMYRILVRHRLPGRRSPPTFFDNCRCHRSCGPFPWFAGHMYNAFYQKRIVTGRISLILGFFL